MMNKTPKQIELSFSCNKNDLTFHFKGYIVEDNYDSQWIVFKNIEGDYIKINKDKIFVFIERNIKDA